MKIVLTGSIGNIGKPLADILIQKKHQVTVISSTTERTKDIEAMGARAAIGQLYDTDFLTQTFASADIVYLMQPPFHFFDKNPDPRLSWTSLVAGYATAIRQAGVQKVIHLSSVGAHTDTGVGILAIHHQAENILKGLPETVAIKFMRPVAFYYNLYAFIPTIKSQGVIIQNYGGDEKEPWVSPLDIACTIAEEMEQPFTGRTVRYIASDEASPNDLAGILGKAIGLPGLKWMVLPDEQILEGLLSAGFNPELAKGLVEMNAARVKNLYEDYNRHKPIPGKVKLEAFAREFASVYQR